MSLDIKCWVPQCFNSKGNSFNRNFFPLPRDIKFKETWLALAGKKVTIPEEQVFICDAHFRKSSVVVVSGKTVGLTDRALPFYEMPQMICRTCMCTIPSEGVFCVVSATVPSTVPEEFKTNFIPCRPEPLYHILTFSIPNLSLEPNPPSLVCLKCYNHIWQYFLFKIRCNSTETAVKGNLSPEVYGKGVLCRSCPEISGTRYFQLNETERMGQVFKQMFLNNFPVDLVPLKLCLKCYNLVFKLTEFHNRCINLDQMLQRCAELSHREAYDLPPLQKLAANEKKIKAVTSPPQTNLKKIKYSSAASTSGCSVNWQLNGPKITEVKGGVCEVEATDSESGTIDVEEVIVVDEITQLQATAKSGSNLNKTEREPQMPKLLPQIEIEEKTEEIPKLNVSAKRKHFTVYCKLRLAILMLELNGRLKTDMDRIQSAKADLEIWVKVMKEFHDMGFLNTIEQMQALWSRMKREARIARKIIGPMSYLDSLVNKYLTGSKLTDRRDSSGLESEDAESRDAVSTDDNGSEKESNTNVVTANIYNVQSGNVQNCVNNAKNSRIPTAIIDCDIICIDDSDDDLEAGKNRSGSIENESHVDACDISNAITKDCNISNQDNDTATPEKPAQPQILNRATSLSLRMVRRPKDSATEGSTVKKKKGKERAPRESWNLEQKLELVRDMRKEFMRLIENGRIASLKYSPWKKILETLASRGFGNRNYQKMYNVWGTMKMSATTHEINGQDIVDDEVWDLLQFQKEVMKGLPKNSGVDKNVPHRNEEIARENDRAERESPAPKKRKLSTPQIEDSSTKIIEVAETTAAQTVQDANHQNDTVHVEEAICNEECNNEEVNNGKPSCSSPDKNPNDDTSKTSTEDQRKLDLIAVIRSFGNKVFKKQELSARSTFWNQVATAFHVKGYDTTQDRIRIMWGIMLRSAKLSWAQEDRRQRVGDQEIIDFMTGVIKEKEMSQGDTRLDLSSEQSEAVEDSGKCDESSEKCDKSSEKCDESSGKCDKCSGKCNESSGTCEKRSEKCEKSSEKCEKSLEKCEKSSEKCEKSSGKCEKSPKKCEKRGESSEKCEGGSEMCEVKSEKREKNLETDTEVLQMCEEGSGIHDGLEENGDFKSHEEIAKFEVCNKIKGESEDSGESTDETVALDYDYVSLEDLRKHFKLDVMKTKPLVTNEVIEISDSDDDG